jgi:hypothetical protein
MVKASHIIAGTIVVAGIGMVIWSLMRVQPTKPKEELKETLTTDRSEYTIGDIIAWKASNLKIGQKYRVGLEDVKGIWSLPTRDEWIADSDTREGTFLIGFNIIPGNLVFHLQKLIEGKYVTVALVPIVVKKVELPPIILPIFETPPVITIIETKRE